MARLRPARTCRNPNSQAWSRYSLKSQRKNYVRAMPRTSILQFNMGSQNEDYDMEAALTAEHKIQLRSNSLEAARQAANRYLEAKIPGAYFFRVLVYPHNVIREHKMATGAGADRMSQGMAHSFGRPISVAARVKSGHTVFIVQTGSQNKDAVREAMRRACSKMSGHYKLKLSRLSSGKAARTG